MTVWPDQVDFARPINFSGWQDTGANIPGYTMESHRGNFIRPAPTRPSIAGGERHHISIATRESLDRHNHGPARLHEGLAPDAMVMISGRQGCSPRLSPVAGGTHLDQIGE